MAKTYPIRPLTVVEKETRGVRVMATQQAHRDISPGEFLTFLLLEADRQEVLSQKREYCTRDQEDYAQQAARYRKWANEFFLNQVQPEEIEWYSR